MQQCYLLSGRKNCRNAANGSDVNKWSCEFCHCGYIDWNAFKNEKHLYVFNSSRQKLLKNMFFRFVVLEKKKVFLPFLLSLPHPFTFCSLNLFFKLFFYNLLYSLALFFPSYVSFFDVCPSPLSYVSIPPPLSASAWRHGNRSVRFNTCLTEQMILQTTKGTARQVWRWSSG